jgi:hypothetical protein
VKSIPATHVLQFYGDDDRSLAASVSRYLAEGLKQEEDLLLIATPEHIESFMRLLRFQASYRDATRTGRLVCLDAQTTLDQIMVDGQPQWNRFERVVGSTVQAARRRTGHSKLRAYGEMVDLLWKTGQSAAAIRLEEYWNTLLAGSADCRLFCAYSIDIFGRNFEPAIVAPILCTHTRVLPVGEAVKLAVDWAVEEILGPGAEELGRYDGQSAWATLPRTVATILWLRGKYPDTADQVLRRARQHYEL